MYAKYIAPGSFGEDAWWRIGVVLRLGTLISIIVTITESVAPARADRLENYSAALFFHMAESKEA